MLCRVFGLHCIKGEDNHTLCICKDIRCGSEENVVVSRVMKENGVELWLQSFLTLVIDGVSGHLQASATLSHSPPGKIPL